MYPKRTRSGLVPLPNHNQRCSMNRTASEPDFDLFMDGGLQHVGDLVREHRPRARASDPETSHEAAESMVDGAAIHRDMILETLAQHPKGLTGDDLDRLHDWPAATACRRLKELQRAGEVFKSDIKRETRSGRLAFVYFRRLTVR